MCLLITLAAALIAAFVWYLSPKARALNLHTLVLAYLGANLMWIVDLIANFINKEPLLDLTGDDALLGLVVVVSGLALWGLTLLVHKNSQLKQV